MADSRQLNAQITISAVNQAGAALNQIQAQLGKIGEVGKATIGALASGLLGREGVNFLTGDLKKAIDMQAELAHVGTAMDETGALKLAHLGEVQAKANELMAEGINTNVDLAESYYLARSAGLDHGQALAAMAAGNTIVTATGKTVAEAQAAAADTTRLLADEFNIFGDKTKDANTQLSTFADLITSTQTGKAFANITELRYALSYLSPIAKGAGVDLQHTLALAALLSESGIHGERAGTVGAALINQLSASGKLAGFRRMDLLGNLDVGKSLEAIDRLTSHMEREQRARFLTKIGFSGEDLAGVELTLDRWKDIDAIANKNTAGVAAAKAAERIKGMDDQLQIVLNGWDRFKEIVGASLLGPLTRILNVIKPLALAMDAFAEAHPHVVALGAALVAFGSAAIIAGGAIQLLGIGATFGSLWAGAMAIASAATWAFNAAVLANPIGVAVLAVAALAAAAYEIVEHWNADFGASMYAAGANLMTMLGHGMVEGALAAVHAAEDIAHRIGRFFVGHSPIPEGALHDMDLGREIAASMRPGPVVAAVRQMAAAAALAIPLSISPAMHAVAPALAARAPGAELATRGAGPIGHVTNNINIAAPRITVNGGTGKPAEIETAVLSAMRTHTHELATELQRHKFNRDRGNY